MEEIDRIIELCKKIIISPRNKKHIKALYIGGSIKPQDRTSKSDIDIIGLVYDTFPINSESLINLELKENISKMKCKLRVLYLSELHGGKQKGIITKLLPIKLFIRRLPFFPLIWGHPIVIEETIGSYTISEEIEVQTKIIKQYIENTNNRTPFEWIPKAIMYLASLELVLIDKYTTSFSEVRNHWNDDKNHIIHDSACIRQKNYEITEEEKENYIQRAINYMDEVNRSSSM